MANMVMARAPVRLPLGGGGTDLPFYCSKFGGLLLSVAINKYVYVMVNCPPIDDKVRVKARINEEVDHYSEIKNELVRASLQHFNITSGVEISFMSDVTDGTGLGTSGAYAVCLANALSYLNRKPLDPKDLAEAASHIEMNLLGRSCGKHDQYMAAFGGINILKIAEDGLVKVEEPEIPQDVLDELKNNLLLFYTGEKHESESILGEQKRMANSGDEATINHYHRIKDIGLMIIDALERGDLINFGQLMHSHWQVKRDLPGGVSNERFNDLYDLARTRGALGGKIIGAGGGGFFMFFCERNKRRSLRHAMQEAGLREIRFSYDWDGAVLLPNFSKSERTGSLEVFHSER